MSKPVEYQYRTRPDWIPEWNGWNTCSKESAEAYEKNPYLYDWHYEVRRLYTTPPQRKPLTDKQILANQTLRYYFGKNGGAGPVSKQGRKVIDAIEAAHGIKK